MRLRIIIIIYCLQNIHLLSSTHHTAAKCAAI